MSNLLPGLLIVDAMNLAWKSMHAYDLCTSFGEDTSAIYGFINQLASVLEKNKMRTLVVWDGGYKDRSRISEEAVSKGIIKTAYKTNRNSPKEGKFLTMEKQLDLIKEFLSYTDVKQVKIDGEEADDIAASYCEKIKDKMPVVFYTCDKDYYQLLDDNVSILNRLKGEEKVITKDTFSNEFGINPYQWVDVGSLSGDDGDNIIGVPGCGEDTALNYIKQYQTSMDLILAMESKFDALRAACPDLTSESQVAKLLELGGVRGNSPAFEGVYVRMPFSGVAMALLSGEIKNIKKIELKFAMYKERIKVAYSLKKMNRNIDVPNMKFTSCLNEKKFLEFCEKFELSSVLRKMVAFKL